ncbi:MAG: alpha/beta hydrolase fold domain-containing protein [Candidatus Eisenbacteria bacterium]|uniref:Alpha/beta hydrolase fold domain-containing protein n=1 Tax=Eiseniibacteriota bacterium TaxID=2212470 RepID=A0A933SFT8_UNCEI|nr:alpha/beta hydrolase fold domain-containing protein [Candidatus Eisenbacteria bacterium]
MLYATRRGVSRGHPGHDPRISPLCANLRGLPPSARQAGGPKIFHDGSVEFADAAKSQGVGMSFPVWPEMNHDFQAFRPEVPEAGEALANSRSVMEQWCR